MAGLTIAVDTTSAGTTTLTAPESVPPALGDNLTINGGVSVSVTAGDLNLQAGDDVVLQSGALASASGAVTVTAAFGDNDIDGSISSSGTVSGASVTFAARLVIEVGKITATSGVSVSAAGILDSNTTGADITAASLFLSGLGGIGAPAGHIVQPPILPGRPPTDIEVPPDSIETQVGSLEALSVVGSVLIENGVTTPVTLNVGVSAGASGVIAGGDVSLVNHGTIDILTDGDIVAGAGNVTVQAIGVGADVNTGGQTGGLASIAGTSTGIVAVEAGRDINLGDATGTGTVGSGSGSVILTAGRNVNLNANAAVAVVHGTGQISVAAGGDITMATSPGTLAGAPDFLTAGGTITLQAGAGHSITADSTGPTAINSAGGTIDLLADDMVLNKAIKSGVGGTVFLQPVGAGVTIGIGTGAGGLGLSGAEINEVIATNLDIGNNTAGKITVGGAVTPALATNLQLQTGAGIELTAGAVLTLFGNVDLLAGGDVTLDAGASVLSAGQIVVTFGGGGLGATADLHSGTLAGLAIDITGGTGNDTVKVAHGGGEDIDGDGGSNTAVFSGNQADYTRVLNADGSWTVTDNRAGSPDGTDTLIRMQSFQFADGTISVTPTISIDPVTSDNTVNHAEAGAAIFITGTTTNVQDGQPVTVTISGGPTVSGTVSGGTWSATLTSAQAQALADGGHSATATVADALGDTATFTGSFQVDETLPTLVNDTQSIVATAATLVVPAGQGVLANDADANSDPLTVTGVSDTAHGAGTIGNPLIGAFGTLTLNADGGYSYNPNHAAALAEGQIGHDVFTYAATDHNGNSATATLDVQVTGHTAGVIDQETYTAVESVTKDVIFGALYDNTGRYTVGSTVTNGLDDAGGHWTYSITGIAQADAAHQDASYSGFVYDLDFQDTGVGTFATAFGSPGFAHGVNDKVNFSGNNYLGSDGDVVTIGGHTFAIGSGHYVVPEGITTATPAGATPAMQEDAFEAVESVTGDIIFGELFDNTNRYSIGSSVTVPGVDNAGGSWTYSITGIGDADAAHQSAALSGFVYDLNYFDTDQNQMFDTFYGTKGFSSGDRTTNYSGNNYLGSEGDLAVVGSRFFAVASGRYVLPDPLPPGANPPTLGFSESSGGDATTGAGSANLTLLNNMAAGSLVTGSGSGTTPMIDPTAAGSTLLTLPQG